MRQQHDNFFDEYQTCWKYGWFAHEARPLGRLLEVEAQTRCCEILRHNRHALCVYVNVQHLDSAFPGRLQNGTDRSRSMHIPTRWAATETTSVFVPAVGFRGLR